MQCTTGQLPVSLTGSIRPPTTCQYCPCPHCRDVTSGDMLHATGFDESSPSSPVIELGHPHIDVGPCLGRAHGNATKGRHDLERHLREILPAVGDRELNRPPQQFPAAPLPATPTSHHGCVSCCTIDDTVPLSLSTRSTATPGLLLSAAEERGGRHETVYCTAVVSSTTDRDDVMIPAALGLAIRSPSQRNANVGIVTSCS